MWKQKSNIRCLCADSGSKHTFPNKFVLVAYFLSKTHIWNTHENYKRQIPKLPRLRRQAKPSQAKRTHISKTICLNVFTLHRIINMARLFVITMISVYKVGSLLFLWSCMLCMLEAFLPLLACRLCLCDCSPFHSESMQNFLTTNYDNLCFLLFFLLFEEQRYFNESVIKTYMCVYACVYLFWGKAFHKERILVFFSF